MRHPPPLYACTAATLTTVHPSTSYTETFSFLDACSVVRRPAMLRASAVSGKATSALAWAHSRGRDCHVVRLTPETSAEDLLGSVRPLARNTETGARLHNSAAGAPFAWVNGPVTDALERGHVVVLAGVQEPAPAVMEALNGVLETAQRRTLLIGGKSRAVHPSFMLVGTLTAHESFPSNDRLGAPSRLSPSFLNRFAQFDMSDAVTPQLKEAMLRSCTLALATADSAAGRKWRSDTVTAIEASSIGGVARCVRALSAAKEVVDGMTSAGAAAQCTSAVVRWALTSRESSSSGPLKEHLGALTAFNVIPAFSATTFAKHRYALPKSRVAMAQAIAAAVKLKVALVLEGITAIGKTSLGRHVANKLDVELTFFPCHRDTSVEDLFGM